ncbi:uncharacterized protein LOC123298533 isoform X2 [Chrysoperla carnea]|uniref:uncharacterized protein LOC123298533 isoform X2 n=1 Tax=Chrysoperla carnea TaxID=189513 RepID=UPI001D076AC2|nr:uncharacterized protein LOC123298533 isoform X2 [Chrysoperla carnea]
MDELSFRISRLLETLQVRLALTSERSKAIIQHGSEVAHEKFVIFWNSENVTVIKLHVNEFQEKILDGLQQCQISLNEFFQSPIETISSLVQFIKDGDITVNRYSFAAGILVGLFIGILIGSKFQTPPICLKLMKSVVCSGYNGIDRIAFVDDIILPAVSRPDQVLVQVKSASIHDVDFQICNGYGRYIRKCLATYYDNKKTVFPIILGRSCSGVVLDIGCRVNKVEIGDEVWVTSPVWCPGTISEVHLTRECFVGKKPTKISFEGAASLSYAGCIALECLDNIGLNEKSAFGKKVFIENCCTPEGCVLTQVLKSWGAILTTSSSSRAAPVSKAMGSSDNIVYTPKDDEKISLDDFELKLLLKSLELKEPQFDIIFITKNRTISKSHLKKYLNKKNGKIVSTLPKIYYSDYCSSIFSYFVCFTLKVQYFIQNVIFTPKYTETRMLDMLHELVENEHLQSVVDHIYPAQNIELAITHKMSTDAIVLSFHS